MRASSRKIHRHLRAGLFMCCLFLSRAASHAQPDDALAKTASELSLEDLVNIKVTSVSKKETSLEDSPAAVTVITQEDIRRYGISSVPDALRLVPGMDVARINSHEWAISARGFNAQFANKLLVLVDGRSVYTTAFGGVLWGTQDLVMEDLDRIEVIRGPGSTLWGANAVNGVINIITKSAKETQGGLLSTTVGTEDQPSTTIQYGGQLATNLYYRAYVKYFNRDGLVDANGSDAPDPWSGIQGGLRLDWEPSLDDKVTLQGDYYQHRVHENQTSPSLSAPYLLNANALNHDSGGNILAHWSHDFSDTSSLDAQVFYDHFSPQQLGVDYSADTIDFDAHHRFELGSRNDIVWGLGYRRITDELRPGFYLEFNPGKQQEHVYSSFVQDEITLIPESLKATLGSKFEHNSYTGFEVQPSARMLWTPTEQQAVWAAVSRAIRTPARGELSERVNIAVFPPSPTTPPVVLANLGNPNLKSEELIAYELGYRIQVANPLSFELAGFYNNYDNLIAPVATASQLETVPLPPHILAPATEQNYTEAHTYGAEISARWQVTPGWQVTASYSWIELHFDNSSPLFQGSPEQQFQIRSTLNLPHHFELSGAIFYVDGVETPYGTGLATIPSYVRLDVGLSWHPSSAWELGIWGQNLLDDRHLEFSSYKTSLLTEIPRGLVARFTWRF